MLMASQTAPWTIEQRDRLPDDGNRYEVVYGELFLTPAPSVRHELVVRRLIEFVNVFASRHGLGTAFGSSTEVYLETQNVVMPDLVVFPLAEALLPARWRDMPTPILVAEVSSPETWRRDAAAKRSAYLAGNIADYWIVDHEECTVTVVRPGREDEQVTETLRWSPRATDAVLEIPLAEVFR